MCALIKLCCREPFPLLADGVHYTPDTLDIWGDRSEMDYWLGVLLDQVGTVVEKAAACDNKPGVLSLHTRLVSVTALRLSFYGNRNFDTG